MQHSEGLVVEVGVRGLGVAGGVDLQCLCSDPVVLSRILVGIHDKVVALGCVDDDVVQVWYGLKEEAIGSNEGQVVTVNGYPVSERWWEHQNWYISLYIVCTSLVHPWVYIII